ncbi:MAG: ATP-binding cassette domain-containing protein [Rhizobiaceae bacterium]
MAPLLKIDNAVKRYRLPRRKLFEPARFLKAVDGVSLEVGSGEVVGIVGESGSGKSTLARLAMAFEKPDAGRVTFLGEDMARIPSERLHALRRKLQIVFQDPFGSLNPRRTVGWSVGEPLLADPSLKPAHRRDKVLSALEKVGLSADLAARYPHQFSGGQRQRIAIARAIVTEPALIVADEPVASLDVSVQAQILNLFMDLQEELGVAMLFISHDLAVVASLCDRIAVMQTGRIVEQAAVREILSAPKNAYTRALFEAA